MLPNHILGKPGRLTDEEFQIIKSHTTHGSEILSHFKSLPNVNEGARFHHERYDGKVILKIIKSGKIDF